MSADGSSGNSIGGKLGLGFIDGAGRVKSRETLAREDQQAKSLRNKTEEQAVESALEDRSASSALRIVGAKFNQKAINVLNGLNQQKQNVAAAEKIVKEQIQVAKDLRQALKDDDEDAIAENRKKFDDIEKQRADLAAAIGSDNKRLKETDSVLNLGNKIQGSARVPDVNFGRRSAAAEDLDSVEAVNDVLKDLKAERTDLREQRTSIRDAAQDVKAIVSATDEALTSIQRDSIRSIQQAEDAANNVANAIRSAGSQAVLAQNINAEVVRSLLG